MPITFFRVGLKMSRPSFCSFHVHVDLSNRFLSAHSAIADARCSFRQSNKLSILSQQIASDKGIHTMASSRVFPLLFLLPLIAAVAATAPPADEIRQLWSYSCDDEWGYNANITSTFKSNLHKVLTTLSATNPIPNGFLNLSFGKGRGNARIENAGVTVLCRGDVDAATCRSCVDYATSKLTALCPDRYDSFGSAENCSVKFSRGGVDFGSWLMLPMLWSVNDTNTHSWVVYVDDYTVGLRSLLEGLPDRTASGDSRLKFATGEANITANQSGYALTQCSPDLSSFNCRGCLYKAVYNLLDDSRVIGRTGARVVFPSCSARYAFRKFYSSPDLPPSPDRSSNAKGSVESKTVIIAVLSVIACLSLLTNFLLCYRRRRETKPMAHMELDELHTYGEHNKQAYGVFGGSYARQ